MPDFDLEEPKYGGDVTLLVTGIISIPLLNARRSYGAGALGEVKVRQRAGDNTQYLVKAVRTEECDGQTLTHILLSSVPGGEERLVSLAVFLGGYYGVDGVR